MSACKKSGVPEVHLTAFLSKERLDFCVVLLPVSSPAISFDLW